MLARLHRLPLWERLPMALLAGVIASILVNLQFFGLSPLFMQTYGYPPMSVPFFAMVYIETF